eukprot:360249-Hanusia_phi.AAC.1
MAGAAGGQGGGQQQGVLAAAVTTQQGARESAEAGAGIEGRAAAAQTASGRARPQGGEQQQ